MGSLTCAEMRRLEEVAFRQGATAEDLMEKAGLEVETIVAAGGGASSPLWLKMKADILNRSVNIPVNPEAGSLGAAILAGGAANLWDPAEAASNIARVKTTIEPDAKQVRIYESRLDIYRTLYPALKQVNHRICNE